MIERLNKKLVELGVCSRRKADEFIRDGKILVNGVPATLGIKVSDEDLITVNGEAINKNDEKIILAYNKPKGVICTESDIEKNVKISDKIKEFGFEKRLFTIGRLDKDTTGLIFLTNDGDLAKDITNTHIGYEKEYEVRVSKAITDKFVSMMEKGVFLTELNKKTKPCKIIRYNDESRDYRFNIIINQGLNRQIRRMCRELGYHVASLKRVRIINYKLGDLKIGEYKIITRQDIYGKRSEKKNK